MILRDHRQDGNVVIGGIGNLARCGLSAISEIQTKTKNYCKCDFICCWR